jgi:hypothetical protein
MRDKDLQQLSEEIKKDWSDTLGYKRFNRHEVFSMGDTSFVLDLIDQVRGNHSIKNSLYGLFDGYWYDDLLYELYSKTDVSSEDLLRLERILMKVEVSLSDVLTA